MGKEQELLEAARTGNVAVIERLLANRVRRSQGGTTSLTSAFASLWNFKGPNVNCLDANGETPLHLAALNGHRDVVTLLLQNEALVNSADERGCTPLHLAAWSGRSDICSLLLQPFAIPAQINSQNSDGETPLHCAAQHGHCGTVSVLLQDNSDPTIRNLGEFSPLDLAAQYGRLDVVKQLITTHPTLVNNLIPNHSPLHLASRSGHRAIVQYLLDSGFSVNLTTDSGTALHEAATYCKTDVIKLLLDRGVNVEQRDKRNLTAADILKSLPSQKACEASKLISEINRRKDHIKGLMKVVMQDRTPSEDEYDFLPPDPIPVPESELKSSPLDSPPLVPEQGDSGSFDMYSKISKNSDLDQEVREQSPVSPDKSPPPVPPRAPSIRCSVSSNESDPRSPPIACSPASISNYIPMGKVFPDAGAKPKKPPRKSRDRPSLSGQDQDKQLESDTVGTTTDDSLSSHHDAPEDYVAMSPVSKTNDQSDRLPSPVYCNVTFRSRNPESQENQSEEMDIREISNDIAQNPVPPPLPPANPVRMNSKGDNSCQPESVSEPTSESLDVSNATEGPSSDDWSTRSEVSALEKLVSDPSQKTDQSEKTDLSERTDQSEEFSTATSDDGLSTSSASVIAGTGETVERVQKPNSLEFDNKRTSGEVPPLSPTNYVQPPTPDYPPPSPSTAVQDIKQKINPQEKRKSKDMETLTEASILASFPEKAPKPKPKPDMRASIKASVETKEEIIVEIQSVPKERIPSQVLETVIERVEEVGNNGEVSETEKLTEHVQLRQRISSEGSSEGDTSIFAGLLRGSTPGGPRNVVSQICESDVVRRIKTKRQSVPSSFLSFDPVMEREEDKDTIDPASVLAGLDDALKNNAAAVENNGHTKHEDGNIDESEEWANIAATFAEFGVGLARESVFVREYEADFARLLAASSKIQSVGEWLECMGLGQYENTLVANGFDDTDFLGGKVMEEQDLETIGITEKEHRKKLLVAAASLPKLQPIDQQKLPPSVEQWLKSLRLEQYLDTFNTHKYNTMERVVKVWELELTNVLDITSIGHRKRILASLGDRPAPERIGNSNSPNILKKPLNQGVEVISPFDHIDLYKDYTGVRSTAVDDPLSEPSQNPLLMFGTGNDGLSQGQNIRDSTIHIRPPHLAHTTGSVRQWRHRPEILIKGCCNYTAQYLGSTLVKELNGPESTQEGISKLKVMGRYCKKFVDEYLQKSTEVIAKIPTIMLSISYRGVKFIDAKSKKVICDHEIANIFCACQDSEHLNFFAYITKDRETQKHYCHVFSVRSRELAGEIILTLGEAFEIAYQMALKEKAEEDAMEFEKKLSPSDQEDTTSASSKASLNTL